MVECRRARSKLLRTLIECVLDNWDEALIFKVIIMVQPAKEASAGSLAGQYKGEIHQRDILALRS
jgi:hypothetical protein